MIRLSAFAALALLAISLTACTKAKTNGKATFPLKGIVKVDGVPANQVQVTLHDDKGFDTVNPSVSQGFTNENGEFVISTYNQGDGVPVGDYTLTFLWGELNLFTMQYGGEDKLKERYLTPEKSTIKVKVEGGKPTDMGTIDLTTR